MCLVSGLRGSIRIQLCSTLDRTLAEARADDKYAAKAAKFNRVESVVLYFPSNFGAETTKVFYVGLMGKFEALSREIVDAVYELRPVPADHKTKANSAPQMGL